MTCILTADIHLNDKPTDQHRWGLVDWLLKQDAEELVICGDMTDAKDRHSAQLVNRFHKAITRLEAKFKVILLKGNHDYIDPLTPFFEFLGNESDTLFIKEPKIVDLSIGKATFIPAGEKWNFKLHNFPLLFTHATFNGAKAENGQQLTGVDPHVLDHWDGLCYSGDVHVPQRLAKGKITYIGAPYHTRFGDNFKPRIIRLTKNDEEDLFFPAPRKLTFHISHPEDLEEEKAEKGDQVKVKCYLRRAEYVEWRAFKREIRDVVEAKGWVFAGAEPVPVEITKKPNETASVSDYHRPEQLIAAYAKQKKATDDHIRIGKELL